MPLSPRARLAAALIACLALAALGAQYAASAAHYPGLRPGALAWRLLRYFTILTNMIVLATYARAALAGRGPGAVWGGGVTLWIVMVGLVNYALLAGHYDGLQFWADLGLHAAVPLAVAGWWIAWGESRGLHWRAALAWLGWPLAYLVYALVRGQADGRYPYFFIDPRAVGWTGVGLWFLVLGVVFLCAGLLLVALARRREVAPPAAGRRGAA